MKKDPYAKERAEAKRLANKTPDSAMEQFFGTLMQQAKGEDGKSPVFGKDFFTPEQIEKIKIEIIDRIPKAKNGKDADYDLVLDYVLQEVDRVVTEQVSKIPPAKNGEKGADAVVDMSAIVASLLKVMPKMETDEVDYLGIKDYIDNQVSKIKITPPLMRNGGTNSLRQLTDVVLDALETDAQGNYILGGSSIDVLGDIGDVDASDSTTGYVLTRLADGSYDMQAAPGAGGGETNTMANVGTAGVGVYKTKVGAEFKMKNINAGSTKVTITDDTGDDEIDIDVDPSQIASTDLSDTADIAYQTDLHAAVTVTDTAEIDMTLTGQNIKADIIAGSIDETKLDVSVNASLDLADSATQPADIADFITDVSTDTLTGKTYDADAVGNVLTNVGFAEFDTDVADTMSFVAGSYLDSPSVDITSDGTTITLAVEKSGGGDLRVHFLTGLYTWDTTPAATVALTAGSDTIPTMNYIYIDEATKTLTANTTGFPVADIVRVSEVLCPSATEVQAEGPYAQRNWTDHMSSTTCGHLAHINLWIRSQAATWLSGVALTPTITVQGAGEDNVDVSTSSGSVLQLHSHTYPAFNTAVSSHMQIINHNATPYTEITDLNAADQDDAGNAIGNNDYTNLVLWGVVSEDSNDCHLMVNLPSDFHSTSVGATIDAEGYSNYTIPENYKGTGFLIGRLTLKYSTGTSGTWTLVENKDLRDGGATGGSGTGSTEFSDNVFRILDDADTSKEIAFQASGITTATTRTITVPDVDVTLATPTELTKLSGIETAADVTDAVNVGAINAAATSKATPIDADSFPIVDSAASNVIKRLTFTNLKAFLKTYFDSATQTLTNKTLDDAKIIGAIFNLTGTAETLVIAHASGYVTMDNAAANTLTVPPNSSVAFSVGTRLMVQQIGAGATTIAAGAGVTINAPSTATLLIDEVDECRGLFKSATDVWELI